MSKQADVEMVTGAPATSQPSVEEHQPSMLPDSEVCFAIIVHLLYDQQLLQPFILILVTGNMGWAKRPSQPLQLASSAQNNRWHRLFHQPVRNHNVSEHGCART
jgi:hypothetical protein